MRTAFHHLAVALLALASVAAFGQTEAPAPKPDFSILYTNDTSGHVDPCG